jgi:hypothetical protein
LFYSVIAAGAVAGLLFIQFSGPYLIKYATQITRIGGDSLPEYWNMAQHLAFRRAVIRSQATAGSTLESVMSQDNLGVTMARPIIYTVFPMRFWPMNGPVASNSPLADVASSDHGTTIASIIEWATIPVWIGLLPLMTVGFFKLALGAPSLRALAVYYISTLLFVTFVSCELRHALGFIIVHPTIATAGYVACRRSRKVRLLAICLSVVIAGAIVAINYSSGAIL